MSWLAILMSMNTSSKERGTAFLRPSLVAALLRCRWASMPMELRACIVVMIASLKLLLCPRHG